MTEVVGDSNTGTEPLVAAPPLLNPANLLTIARLLLVPVFALLLIGSDGTDLWLRAAACAAFGVASLTDLWDGRIARSRNLVTTFGQVADPIADKALTGTGFVILSMLGMLPWWVTVVVLAREVGVTVIRFWVIRHGVIPASRGGKLKTMLQAVAIPWYVWPWPYPIDLLSPWLMAAAVVVTVVTGADYVARALVLRRTSDRALAKKAARAARAARR
ncbi:MAG TPA: CDP-diacylglycerol--glycerol-3-phosphate 3-phosphatidyltransferase [Mycobacteriales bacterium]